MEKKPSSSRPAGIPLAELSEAQLWSLVEPALWPNGFVCPKCRWRPTKDWAENKARHDRQRRGFAKPGRDPQRFHQNWRVKNSGRVICQNCHKQVSLKSVSPLKGSHLRLTTIRDAVLCLLGAADGISAMELRAKVVPTNPKFSTLSARKLIKKFHAQMQLLPEEQLGGVVEIEEFALDLGPSKGRHGRPIVIVIGVERKSGKAGRIGFKLAPAPEALDVAAIACDMVREKSTIETCRKDVCNVFKASEAYTIKLVGDGNAQINADPLPLCSEIFKHMSNVLKNTYRGAIKRVNLQGYLDEIAFRRNHGDDLVQAAFTLLIRLICPPCKTSEEKKRRRQWEQDVLLGLDDALP